VSPDGAVMSLGASQETGISVVEIDPRIAERKAINEHNDLIADRRTAFYRLL
jgi:hypothetical protein